MKITSWIKNIFGRRNLSLFVVIIMISSVLLSFILYSGEKSGGEKKLGLVVDFGEGYGRYPLDVESGNESAFDILRSKVGSVHLNEEKIDCINGICNNEENKWVFIVNGNETIQSPMGFFPTGFDVIEFKYENLNETSAK